jgi:hypothetical protein
MVIVRYAGGTVKLLSTETLPAGEPANTEAVNTDTGQRFFYDGSSWLERRQPQIGPGRFYVYKVGTGSTGPWKALNRKTGEIVYTGTTGIDEVITPVLDDINNGDAGSETSFLSHGGHVYIDGTDTYHYLSNSFAGFTIPQYTIIEGPYNARLLVKNAYTGYVFRVPSWRQINSSTNSASTQGVSIRGMSLHEDGTVARNWTGILFEAWAENAGGNPQAGGIAGCSVIGTRINNCKTGLMLNQTSTLGWITTCWFEKMYISAPKWAGVDQQLMSEPINEFNNNIFKDIAIQSSNKAPAYGFRNMGHRRSIYINCLVWDAQNGQIKGNTDPTTKSGVLVTEHITIIGGILAHRFNLPSSGTFPSDHALVLAGYYNTGDPYPKLFQDTAIKTKIFGDFEVGSQLSQLYLPADTGTLTVTGRKTDVNTLLELVAPNDTVSTIQSWWNGSRSERFSFSKTSTAVIFEAIRQTSAGSLRPILFRQNDVPGVGTIQSFQINTNGDIQVTENRNIVLGTTTGTKIGTSTSQKLGFYNKTPIVQPAAISSPSADVTSLKTAVDALRTALTNLGLTA